MNSIIPQIETGKILINESKADRIRILLTGDFCPDARIEKLCIQSNYEPIYNDALHILRQKDLSITNLECPITRTISPILKKGPHLSADTLCINAIRYGAFDVVTLANNHILDHGEQGLFDTLYACKEAGIKTVGAGKNLKRASQPLFISIKGTIIAILNFAEREFSIAGSDRPGANPLDPIKNFYQINAAKKRADILIVVIHGGSEHYPLPSPRMVAICRFFADLGVTAVVGHHTHIASGLEVYNGVPIFYSLGNFLFDRNYPHLENWSQSYFVKLIVADNCVSKILLFPYYQCHNEVGLSLMDSEDKSTFLAQIAEHSSVIQNDDLLKKKWDSFCKGKKYRYLSIILTLNRMQRIMLRKGIFTRTFFKYTKLLQLLNMLRCDSHRDVAMHTLQNELKKNTQSGA